MSQKSRETTSDPAEHALVALLRTADEARRHVSGVISGHGMSLQQYNVLRILRGAGGEPLATYDVAERLIERAPGITRLMDRLEAAGWVRRERCPEDRRQVHCWITDAGLEKLAVMDEPVLAADREIFAPLSTREVGRLVELLTRCRSTS